MPTLSLKLMFGMIPEKAPILLKPLLRGIFDALNRRLALPKLQTHADFVSNRSFPARYPNSRHATDRSAPEQVNVRLVRRG